MAAATPAETDLLRELARRAGGIPSLDQLVDLATPDEASAIAAIAARIRSPSHQAGPPDPAAAAAAYDRHKARVNARQKAGSESAREIGPLPPVKDPARREACRLNYGLAAKTYFPNAFPLPFSDSHRKAISKIETAVLMGGLFALAMPRGSGKTTLAVRAVLWAILYAHHLYAMLLGATDEKAEKLLDGIKTELTKNVLLLEDFPEIVYPLWQLEGVIQRCKGQLLDGEPTGIVWTDKQLILPSVPGSPASQSIIETGGLLTAVRGGQFVADDGTIRRPSLILPDDPQTRESARSIDQSENRIEIITGDVLGMAGPGKPLAMVMPCTVICKGDAAHALLDRSKYPELRGETTKMMPAFPQNMGLWEEYNDLRERCLAADEGDGPKGVHPIQPATDFYAANQAAMDLGAEVSWPERKLPHELSAIQHAMNLYFRSPVAFASEYQNEPISLQDDEEFWTADQISAKLSGYARRVVPPGCQWVTAFVDVHARLLYWMVCAWERNFTGYVLDYGVTPKQPRATFIQQRARPTLREKYRGKGLEGAIYSGLEELTSQLLGTVYKRTDGAEMRIVRQMIDCNWYPKLVGKFCLESPHTASLCPSRGRGIGPQQIPIHAYQHRPGEFIGDEWHVPPAVGGVRVVQHDKGHWTTVAQRRLAAHIGDPGCVTLYGRREDRTKHDFLARHLTSEQRHTVEGKRRVDVWELKPGESENHWLDCYVGNCVAASMLGAKVLGSAPAEEVRTRTKKKRRPNYAAA